MTHLVNGYADLLIVKTTIYSAQTKTTVLVGNDADLLVLLCYHTPEDGQDLFFRPEPKENAKGARVWQVRKVKEQLGTDLCKNLLFLPQADHPSVFEAT